MVYHEREKKVDVGSLGCGKLGKGLPGRTVIGLYRLLKLDILHCKVEICKRDRTEHRKSRNRVALEDIGRHPSFRN
jgi:hypothetical protein